MRNRYAKQVLLSEIGEAGQAQIEAATCVIIGCGALGCSLAELLTRVHDMDTRGLVIGPCETYEQLYRERQPLYEQYAEVTIAGAGMTVENVAAAIEEQVCGTAAQQP